MPEAKEQARPETTLLHSHDQEKSRQKHLLAVTMTGLVSIPSDGGLKKVHMSLKKHFPSSSKYT